MPWNHHVIIPNVEKMYMDLQKKGLGKEFADYMMDGRPEGTFSIPVAWTA